MQQQHNDTLATSPLSARVIDLCQIRRKRAQQSTTETTAEGAFITEYAERFSPCSHYQRQSSPLDTLLRNLTALCEDDE